MSKELEFGDYAETRGTLNEQDQKMHVSAGFIIRASLGSLIALRNYIKALFPETRPGQGLIHYQHSGPPLFVVHWNDLTEEFQESLKRKRD